MHVLRATDGDVRTQAFSLFFFVIFLCFYFVADDFMHLIMTGPT